jgi:hypothetical protein
MPKLTRLLFVLFLAFAPILTFTPTAQAEPTKGLGVDVYTFDPSALPDRQAYTLCASDTVWVSTPNIDADWGDGIVAGCQGDFVLIHYSGYLISPKSGDITFQSWADDGFWFSLDDVPVIDDWVLKGCSGSSATVPMVANQPYKFDAWWYEFGGGACNRLYWDAEGEGMNIVSPEAFSSEPVVPPVIPTLSKPVGLNGVADGTNVDLVWASIVEDTPIERYAVMWTWGDNPGWGLASVGQSITIGGLPEDTDVTFRVRSDNDSLGVYSEFSDPFVVHTGFDEVVEPPIDPPVEPPVEPEPEPEPKPEPKPVVVPPVVIEPEPPVVEEPIVEEPVVEEPIVEPVPEPSITDVDLASIDPQSLSDEDVALLAEDALETFETAVEGSEEYLQALEQLMIVAQADDIVVSEELASVPVLGATIVGLTNAFNALGNFGADMSPKVRAKAEQSVVAAVIVTQIATTAVGLTVSAPSSIRRIN